ncbi:MAG TPA: macro domain-containing protein, partial [bacterium]|nr:macro domain-containing protein [bacterium]
KLADSNGLKSIAFPAISTGIFGYPLKEAGEISIRAIIDTVPELKNIKKIRFVLFDEISFSIFSEELKKYKNL